MQKGPGALNYQISSRTSSSSLSCITYSCYEIIATEVLVCFCKLIIIHECNPSSPGDWSRERDRDRDNKKSPSTQYDFPVLLGSCFLWHWWRNRLSISTNGRRRRRSCSGRRRRRRIRRKWGSRQEDVSRRRGRWRDAAVETTLRRRTDGQTDKKTKESYEDSCFGD